MSKYSFIRAKHILQRKDIKIEADCRGELLLKVKASLFQNDKQNSGFVHCNCNQDDYKCRLIRPRIAKFNRELPVFYALPWYVDHHLLRKHVLRSHHWELTIHCSACNGRHQKLKDFENCQKSPEELQEKKPKTDSNCRRAKTHKFNQREQELRIWKKLFSALLKELKGKAVGNWIHIEVVQKIFEHRLPNLERQEEDNEEKEEKEEQEQEAGEARGEQVDKNDGNDEDDRVTDQSIPVDASLEMCEHQMNSSEEELGQDFDDFICDDGMQVKICPKENLNIMDWLNGVNFNKNDILFRFHMELNRSAFSLD